MFKRMIVLGIIVLTLGTAMAAAQLDVNAACAGTEYMTPRLAGGMKARVISSEPLDVYMDFNIAADVVGQVAPGAIIPINSAPRCQDGTVWWQSNFRAPTGPDDTPFGWLPESIDGEYVLEPYLQTLSVPATGQPITAANVSSIEQVAQVEYGMVSSVVWSDNTMLVAINTVGAIWIHDLLGNPPVRLAPNELDTNLTTDMVFSADGGLLATVGTSSSGADARPVLYTWSTEDGGLQSALTLEQEEYGRIGAISPDFSLLATAQWDGSITLWDLADDTARAILKGHELVGCLKFSPDGQTLASLGSAGMMVSDTTLRVWDVASGTQRGVIDMEAVSANLTFSPDSQQIAVPAPSADSGGNPDGAVWVIDTTTIEVLHQFSLTSSFGDVSLNGDGTLLAASGAFYDDAQQRWAGAVTFFDLVADAMVHALPLSLDLRRVSFSPDSHILVLVYADSDFWGPDRVTFWQVA